VLLADWPMISETSDQLSVRIGLHAPSHTVLEFCAMSELKSDPSTTMPIEKWLESVGVGAEGDSHRGGGGGGGGGSSSSGSGDSSEGSGGEGRSEDKEKRRNELALQALHERFPTAEVRYSVCTGAGILHARALSAHPAQPVRQRLERQRAPGVCVSPETSPVHVPSAHSGASFGAARSTPSCNSSKASRASRSARPARSRRHCWRDDSSSSARGDGWSAATASAHRGPAPPRPPRAANTKLLPSAVAAAHPLFSVQVGGASAIGRCCGCGGAQVLRLLPPAPPATPRSKRPLISRGAPTYQGEPGGRNLAPLLMCVCDNIRVLPALPLQMAAAQRARHHRRECTGALQGVVYEGVSIARAGAYYEGVRACGVHAGVCVCAGVTARAKG
jgi:hypothetical protein